MIWITSDTHFNHDTLINRGIRKPDFNEVIIKKWNAKVLSGDTVIHCGDVIMRRDIEIQEILKSLNGNKILVRGNHDKQRGINYWIKQGFVFACDTFYFKYHKTALIFTHMPLEVFEGDYNIHGHIHSEQRRNELTFKLTKQHINVAMDENDLNILSLDLLLNKAKEREGKNVVLF